MVSASASAWRWRGVASARLPIGVGHTMSIAVSIREIQATKKDVPHAGGTSFYQSFSPGTSANRQAERLANREILVADGKEHQLLNALLDRRLADRVGVVADATDRLMQVAAHHQTHADRGMLDLGEPLGEVRVLLQRQVLLHILL